MVLFMKKICLVIILLGAVILSSPLGASAQTADTASTTMTHEQVQQLLTILRTLRDQLADMVRRLTNAITNQYQMNEAQNKPSSNTNSNQSQSPTNSNPLGELINQLQQSGGGGGGQDSGSQATAIPVDYQGDGQYANSPQAYTGGAKGAVYCGPPNGAVKPGEYTFGLMTTYTNQEGEKVGMRDNALSSMEDFRSGRAKCVSVATSEDLTVSGIPYGTRLHCPELDRRYNNGNEIPLVKVDVGSKKYFYGTSRLDLYTDRDGAVPNISKLKCIVLPADKQVAP
jgi:hypothetical protein